MQQESRSKVYLYERSYQAQKKEKILAIRTRSIEYLYESRGKLSITGRRKLWHVNKKVPYNVP
jgi:hypothetical protein